MTSRLVQDGAEWFVPLGDIQYEDGALEKFDTVYDKWFGKFRPITEPIAGRYQLIVTAFTFEPESDLDVEMVLYGQAYGIAGTDNMRRDLAVGLLWGTPVALAGKVFKEWVSVPKRDRTMPITRAA